ncbi:respiratory chain complex I subunit 1 family protein [Leminorella grimontii]|uniref:respiratory chain complex I subunit 1 family protein n=1 Tax=Leminorella grimontii TaxID=82981 RepID=UPI00208C5A09|nr:respiratory chain complex I subunit 1 family protein [Leminorella grimontii]GKX61305.1 hydrogenase 3 membrane subunit [Leminorella grimontii]
MTTLHSSVDVLSSLSLLPLAFIQALVLLALAPLLSGISRVIKARMQSRRGPGVLQEYRDLAKLLKRQNVAPESSGFISRLMPFVLISSMLVVAMALPLITLASPFGAGGDLITVIYLFALYRFFFALAGLDSGSIFAGIGASREVTLGVLVEPILVLSLLVLALIVGSTNLGSISTSLATDPLQSPSATLLAIGACAFAVFIEMGKIPFDVAEAEQELQEGPLTEYSGPALAMVKLGLALKQVVIASMFVSVLLPFGGSETLGAGSLIAATALFLVKLLVVFVIASLFENSLARGRFLLTSRGTWVGFGVSALAFVFYLTGL